MRPILLLLLLALPVFVSGQHADSLTVTKQIDSLLRQLRPLIEQQKLDAALEIVELAQQKTESAFGREHAAYAICLAFRGKIAQRKEKYQEAESWYLQAMTVQEKVFGRVSPQYAVSISTLSIIYLTAGEYVKAEPLISETLLIREKLFGKQHQDYARTLGTLGSLYYHKGFYGKAELLYLEAMAIFEKTIGKKHPEYAFVLGNLTSVYTETGNYTKAVPSMLEVLEIHAETYRKQHNFYIKGMVNLGALYARMGNKSKSDSLYMEVKDLFNNGLNKENSDYVLVLGNLASGYLENGDIDKAEPLLIEAEEIGAKVNGKEHINYAWALKNLGLLYTAKGDYSRAESYYLAAHKINSEKFEGGHPNAAKTAGLLAQLYRETNQFAKSGDRFVESEILNRHIIEKAAGYTSEAELFIYLQQFQQNTAQLYSFALAHPNPEIAEAAFDNALFYKGFVLNATMQVKNRAHSNAATASQFGVLRAYRHHLTEQYALPNSERDSAVIAELEIKANSLEKELTRTVVGYGTALQQVNWREVQSVLKPGQTAIEFIHFQYHNAKGKATDSIVYAALVLRPGKESPKIVYLFEERELTPEIQGASGANYRKINTLYSTGTGRQKTLYELIWKKLEVPLKGSDKVYYSLSGLLHRLNLGAIPRNSKERFADRQKLVILGSIRQLVIPAPQTEYNNDALLVGGVNYAGNDEAIAAANQDMSSTRGLSDPDNILFEPDSTTRSDSWRFLPATITEVLTLRTMLQSSRMQVSLDTGYFATEESIKQTGDSKAKGAPRVLHFATHGYFFPDPKNAVSMRAGEEIAFKTSSNPLLRSGLILAGAQQVWSSGKPPVGREDGVLTAQEISLLNLSGTELVVLSACETGLGDIDGNEGVYGLQRAFKIAGAKYIVMSLWKVNDQTTAEFMAAFYAQWLKKGLVIPDAFRSAQQQMKVKYPEAYHWAGFVLVE